MCDDDLLTLTYSVQEVREEVTSVPCVVFGEVAWLGVATWRGVATSAANPLQHAAMVPSKPLRKFFGCVEIS